VNNIEAGTVHAGLAALCLALP